MDSGLLDNLYGWIIDFWENFDLKDLKVSFKHELEVLKSVNQDLKTFSHNNECEVIRKIANNLMKMEVSITRLIMATNTIPDPSVLLNVFKKKIESTYELISVQNETEQLKKRIQELESQIESEKATFQQNQMCLSEKLKEVKEENAWLKADNSKLAHACAHSNVNLSKKPNTAETIEAQEPAQKLQGGAVLADEKGNANNNLHLASSNLSPANTEVESNIKLDIVHVEDFELLASPKSETDESQIELDANAIANKTNNILNEHDITQAALAEYLELDYALLNNILRKPDKRNATEFLTKKVLKKLQSWTRSTRHIKNVVKSMERRKIKGGNRGKRSLSYTQSLMLSKQ